MDWKIEIAGPAGRTLCDRLPEPVAAAVLDFTAGPLSENPHRVGKPLGGDLAGSWSARRGPWRIIYDIDESTHVVTVVRIGHRAVVYRRR